ncbi:MAG TPA: hypothetical protein VFC56_11150 [Stellaceae bacterium]|nr:hypothetical protein [Stellaceae bacterium]
MKRTCQVLAVLSSIALGGAAVAAGPPPVTASELIGNTLSAVAFVPRKAGMPGGGELARIMLQAYLGAGGQALVRAWDPARDSYTTPEALHWSLSGSTFCLDLPIKGANPICADINIWGPRVGGVGAKPYAMLDGDLQPGNTLGASR